MCRGHWVHDLRLSSADQLSHRNSSRRPGTKDLSNPTVRPFDPDQPSGLVLVGLRRGSRGVEEDSFDPVVPEQEPPLRIVRYA